ncbi:hypothetical protein H8N00_34745 [Streptomyces sp. AC563]|uniref:hypothetical protein n=1 Tax=Streptomyces buecherae TaxID=2763006 RepID=UPI00164D1712|nr:hypothetical protein [Streptomyces buecherae]MBC3993940.1 hypothetical protein [Streptomyces buecherae]
MIGESPEPERRRRSLAHVQSVLTAYDEFLDVAHLFDRLATRGSGSDRQRAAYGDLGRLADVVDRVAAATLVVAGADDVRETAPVPDA